MTAERYIVEAQLERAGEGSTVTAVLDRRPGEAWLRAFHSETVDRAITGVEFDADRIVVTNTEVNVQAIVNRVNARL